MPKLLLAVSALGSATTAAWLNIEAGMPPLPTLAWSAAAGIFGAGVSYATLRGDIKRANEKVSSAHVRMDEEKRDRIREVEVLRHDMNRGFDRVEEQNRQSTTMLLDAIKSVRED